MNASLPKVLALASFIGFGVALIGLGVYSARRPDLVMDDESYASYLFTDLEQDSPNQEAVVSLRHLAEKYRSKGRTAQANLLYERAIRGLILAEKKKRKPVPNLDSVTKEYRAFLKHQSLSHDEIAAKLDKIHKGPDS